MVPVLPLKFGRFSALREDLSLGAVATRETLIYRAIRNGVGNTPVIRLSDPPPRIHVGKSSLEGSIVRYARSFDLLEVSAEQGKHPRRAGLLEWRRNVGERFVFSTVVPGALASLEAGARTEQLIEQARAVADALGATWWLLRTPPSVTPGPRAARELAALVQRLETEGRRIAWEPRGIWGEEEASRTAGQLGVHLVRDLAREELLDDSDVVYTRLRALGEGARVGAAAAERIADRLADAAEAYVVVEGAGAGRVRQVLRDMLGVGAGGDREREDGSDETEDEDESYEDDEDEEGDDEGFSEEDE